MKLHHFLFLVGSSLIALPSIAPAANYEWTFNGGNLNDFFNNGTLAPAGVTVPNFAVTDGVTIPHIGGQQANILNVPISLNIGDGYNAAFNASGATAGQSYITDYTFIIDLYSPGTANWTALFQTNPDNPASNDADWYLSPDSALGIAEIGYTPAGSVTQNAWHRLTFAASLGNEVKMYIDGTLAFSRAFGVSSRYSLYSGADPGNDVRLFNEGDTSGNYTHALYVNSIAFVDRKLSDAEVSALGAPNAAGILVPEPAAAALLLPVLAGFAARRRRRR